TLGSWTGAGCPAAGACPSAVINFCGDGSSPAGPPGYERGAPATVGAGAWLAPWACVRPAGASHSEARMSSPAIRDRRRWFTNRLPPMPLLLLDWAGRPFTVVNLTPSRSTLAIGRQVRQALSKVTLLRDPPLLTVLSILDGEPASSAHAERSAKVPLFLKGG